MQVQNFGWLATARLLMFWALQRHMTNRTTEKIRSPDTLKGCSLADSCFRDSKRQTAARNVNELMRLGRQGWICGSVAEWHGQQVASIDSLLVSGLSSGVQRRMDRSIEAFSFKANHTGSYARAVCMCVESSAVNADVIIRTRHAVEHWCGPTLATLNGLR